MDIPASFMISTAEESRAIDRRTIEAFGIDEFTSMEVAGISAAKEIAKNVDPKSRGIFFCGKGNNGGDALVAARYLAEQGVTSTIVFVAGDDDLSATAQKNCGLLKKIADENTNVSIRFLTSWDDFDPSVKADFIVDGMLGTGLDSDLRGDYPNAVAWANESGKPIFAMDIPTGIHADSGQVLGTAIRATQTFAFGTLKLGFYLEQGPDHTGQITYCELPFPRYIKQVTSSVLISEEWLPQDDRKPARHKYENGVVYIIAGSEGMTGAAIMAARSAWAEGVGAITLVCPRGLLHVYETTLPQIVKKPVGSKEDQYFKEAHLNEVLEIVEGKKGRVLIGPGLGRNKPTVTFAQNFLADYAGNCTIDADALWALAQQDEWNQPGGSSWILTPHPGELKTLFDSDFSEGLNRLQIIKTAAQEHNITLLSKGFPVIVGTMCGETYITSYDTRIFSRAGFGDTLAGKIAAFWTGDTSPEISCCRALLKGYQMANAVKSNHHTPEPFDLL